MTPSNPNAFPSLLIKEQAMSKKTDDEDKKKKKKPDDKLRQSMLDQMRRTLGLTSEGDQESLHFADEHVSISDVISTGHAHLDQMLTPDYYQKNGVGGIPCGFVSEFFGPNAGGKTSLCLKMAAEVTKKGGMVFWVDAEGSFMTEWALAHGVDLANVIILSKPGTTGEDYLTKLEDAASKGLFRLVVVDSMDALVPKCLLESDLEENARVGAKALLMSRVLPRIVNSAKKGNCAVIFINQIRNKIGVMYGSPETTPGGESLRFYSSLRLRLQQVSGKKDRGIMLDGEEIGIRSEILVKKNRFGPPYGSTIMPIYYRADLKPHALDVVLDAAIGAKVVSVRLQKNKDNDETTTQFLTFAPEENGKPMPGFDDLRKVEGIDVFKEKLTPAIIKLIVAKCQEEKVEFDPDVFDYIKGLEEDPTISESDKHLEKM